MITQKQARDYLRMKMDEWEWERIQIISSEMFEINGEFLVDVEFLFLGEIRERSHLMTVWALADGTLYGEW